MNHAKSRTALVTGAASGIGLACARELAARGWRVFGTTRRVGPESGEPFRWMPMDVDRDGSVEDGVAAVLGQAGRIDLVVSAAGFGMAGAVEDTSLAEVKPCCRRGGSSGR